MLVAFWKYAAMQDISWSVALHKDAHMRYHQDVMFYRDWPMQVTKLSNFATIDKLEISRIRVFSTIRRWRITEVSHFTRILECNIIKLWELENAMPLIRNALCALMNACCLKSALQNDVPLQGRWMVLFCAHFLMQSRWRVEFRQDWWMQGHQSIASREGWWVKDLWNLAYRDDCWMQSNGSVGFHVDWWVRCHRESAFSEDSCMRDTFH